MKFKVSLAQIDPTSGDISGNSRKILKGIAKAKSEECHLVVFPEMCLTGYCLDEKLLINRQFLRENKRALMQEILPATNGIAVVLGFVDFDDRQTEVDRPLILHNSAAICQDERVIHVVHKRLLPAYRYFDDKRYFTPGTEAEPIRIKTPEGMVSIGVLICEDLWEEGYNFKPCESYVEKGVEYLFTINASPFVASSTGQRDGKRFERAQLIQNQTQHYGVPVVYVNTVGIGDNGKNIIPFDGFSMAYDRQARLVQVLDQFSEDQQCIYFNNGLADPVPEPKFDREEEIFNALVMSVREYFSKLGIFKKVLEAVSGGVDSSLGTAIAAEAVGREVLSVYNLPSKYNSETTQRAAQQLAENFKLKYHVIPIQTMVDQVERDFESHLHPIVHSVTKENLQARIRGLIMMAESNDRQALLLTNGNATEIALGYSTLYGDMAGGLSVIGDLPKPDVYALARYVNRKWGRSMIPEEVFEMPASAELKEDQVDPFDYTVVGPIVSEFIEKGLTPNELTRDFENKKLTFGKCEEDGKSLYERYKLEEFSDLAKTLFQRLNASTYKRMQGAPIVVVSNRAFGFDLRETIINGWEAQDN